MHRRQTIPREWLIINRAIDRSVLQALRSLPLRSGILVIASLDRRDRRLLRMVGNLRLHTILIEGPARAARVHSAGELTRALLQAAGLVLISPIYRTRTHPDWYPLGRMRAATLARLASRKAEPIALGGMNASRFTRVEQLGFKGWAGISAFRT